MTEAKLIKRNTVAPAATKRKPTPNLEARIAATVAQWRKELNLRKQAQFAANERIRNGGGVR